MNGADEIIALGPDEGLGQRCDALPKAADVVRNGRQFRRGSFERYGHDRTIPAGKSELRNRDET